MFTPDKELNAAWYFLIISSVYSLGKTFNAFSISFALVLKNV